DVVYALIVTAEGAPISASIDGGGSALKQRLRAAGTSGILEALDQVRRDPDLISLDFPITHNGAQLGRFLVGLSRESVRHELRTQLMIQALIVVAIVLFLSGAIYAVFRFNVLSPVRKLILASRHVARGEYVTVDVKSSDEFGLLAPEITDELQVQGIADRLLQAVAEPIELSGRRLVMHCSVGIALFPDSGDSVESLMVNADEAMYQAKSAQHGTAIFFTE